MQIFFRSVRWWPFVLLCCQRCHFSFEWYVKSREFLKNILLRRTQPSIVNIKTKCFYFSQFNENILLFQLETVANVKLLLKKCAGCLCNAWFFFTTMMTYDTPFFIIQSFAYVLKIILRWFQTYEECESWCDDSINEMNNQNEKKN